MRKLFILNSEKTAWAIYLINIVLITLIIIPVAISQALRFVGEFQPAFLVGPTIVSIIIGSLLARSVLLKRALRKKSEQFRSMVDLAHEFTYLRSIDGQYEYVSPSCIKLTGYDKEAFYSTPNLMGLLIHPDDTELWKIMFIVYTTMENKNPLIYACYQEMAVQFGLITPACQFSIAGENEQAYALPTSI